MVQQGDLKVELVYADTKMAFKEHSKDGKIYVEVEPDVDYFINVRRAGMTQGNCVMTHFIVDEQPLGYGQPYSRVSDEPSYQGLLTLSKGVVTHKALRFTKPRISEDGSDVNRNLMMGKVEIKVFEGVFDKQFDGVNREFRSSISAKAVDINQTGVAKKKSLRSSEGQASVSKQAVGGAIYKTGAHLDTITLNYCAALGLMAVGVLKKPDPWTYQRMTRPAPAGQGAGRKSKRVRKSDVAEEKTVELFDLADEDSEDDA